MKNLNEKIITIRDSALCKSPIPFSVPEMRIIQKTPNNKKFRALTIYPHDEKIIMNLMASYLRDKIDDQFLPNSYAFRAKKQNVTPTHHDAAQKLLDYRKKHNGDLYVAECDIQKFFDTVNHVIVKRKIYYLNEQLCFDSQIDQRVIGAINSYLASYDFRTVARPQAERIIREKNIKNAVLEWPEAELKEYYDDLSTQRIGIPQGGSFSGLMANILLHDADVAACRTLECSDYYYARFCDDMLIVHHDAQLCEKAFKHYVCTLKLLKLPFHEPRKIDSYSACFYEKKSKLPYVWANNSGGGSAPWVSFVGYQVRYDGAIRIRKSSIEKEIEKQKNVVDRAKNLTSKCVQDRGSHHFTRNQILFRVKNRLVSMAVGRFCRGSGDYINRLSWVNGFRLLRDNQALIG